MIRKLSPQVIGKIAAGEVIERPASVVKELVENSLDAGASQISVEIGRGGLDLIRVSDNGCAVAAEELALAFERHATSKLSNETELEQIATLGFRGEALPSIAAVADVEMLSRRNDDAGGHMVRLRQGAVVEERAIGMAPGTVVVVRGLFRRQPARLKFLRSPAAEGAQIASVVSHYALAYPEVRFTLLSDGRLSLQTPGSGQLGDAAAGVYGRQVAEELLSLPADDEEGWEGASLTGLVGRPSLSRANRNYITLFINRRWIRNRSLAYAVEEAYHGLLMSGRYPVAILDIRLPPGEVDVNVHPAKTEVRLQREREVFGFVQREVRRALSRQAPVATVSAAAWAGAAPTPVRLPLVTREGSASGGPPGQLARAPSGESEQAPLSPQLPVLRPLGQVGMVYIVAEGPEGLYLVDQHAAHERVLFERFLDAGAAAEKQGLLDPAPVELSPRQQALFEETAEALTEQGFSLEAFGGRSYLIRAVPAILSGRDAAQAVLE
ncbi:MAG: DNA mismatch repair endonuclease MutL, partial [Dehalococcoidia bacterium]